MRPTARGRRRQGNMPCMPNMPSTRCGKRWSFDSVRLARRPGTEGPRDVPSRPALARAIVVCGTAVALLSPTMLTMLSAQSLAGVASQEQARRESMTRLSRVYTNDDLSNRGGLTISGVPPGTTTRHVDTPDPVVPPAEEPAEEMVRLVSAEPGCPRRGCRGQVLWPVVIGGGVLVPILLPSGPPVLGQGPGPLETILTRGRTRTAAILQRSAARRTLRLAGSSSMAPTRVQAPRRNPPTP